MPARTLLTPFAVDIAHTLGVLRHGAGDPTIRVREGEVWRATRTPAGPATIHLLQRNGGIEVTAWGDGADWALDHAPESVGCHDSAAGFEPTHPLVARLAKELPGVRIGRSRAVLESLVPAVIEQKVTGFEARRAWRQLVRRFGEPAPGPGGLYLAPAPPVLADLGYYDFHPLGIERKRADTIRRVCAHASRLELLVDLPPAEAERRLQELPGVGAWTAAEVGRSAFGDTDAVSVGDYHLPDTVAWALAGEPRADDDRMLQLLEPFRPHRARVIRLIEVAGISAPRRGPRLAPHEITAL